MAMKRGSLRVPFAFCILSAMACLSLFWLMGSELAIEQVVEWHNRGESHVPKHTLCIFADDAFRSFVKNYFCSLKQALATPADVGVIIVTWEPSLVEHLQEWSTAQEEPLGFAFGSLRPAAWQQLGMNISTNSSGTVRMVGGEDYKRLIKRKIPMIRLLASVLPDFIFSDGDIAWRDDQLLTLLERSPNCDMTFMSDARDKISLCQILQSAPPQAEPLIEVGEEQQSEQIKEQYYPACGPESAWQTYPSEKVRETQEVHDLKHVPEKDVARGRRGGHQGYALLNMGFVHVRSTPRSKYLLDLFSAELTAGDYSEEQDAVYHVLAATAYAPEHRFLDPLDGSMEKLGGSVARLCILPPELYPNGFITTRMPWVMDYARAFAKKPEKGVAVEHVCPCHVYSQFQAISVMPVDQQPNSLIHFNGLTPDQKIPAAVASGLWFMPLDESVCSAVPTIPKPEVLEWSNKAKKRLGKLPTEVLPAGRVRSP